MRRCRDASLLEGCLLRFFSRTLCLRGSRRGSRSKAATTSVGMTLPQLLAAKTAQFRHAKDLVRFGGMETGTWTFDEFSKLVADHAVG